MSLTPDAMLSGVPETQRFELEIASCCGPWTLVSARCLSESVSRSVIECDCGERRVLTVTNLRARVELEVVA